MLQCTAMHYATREKKWKNERGSGGSVHQSCCYCTVQYTVYNCSCLPPGIQAFRHSVRLASQSMLRANLHNVVIASARACDETKRNGRKRVDYSRRGLFGNNRENCSLWASPPSPCLYTMYQLANSPSVRWICRVCERDKTENSLRLLFMTMNGNGNRVGLSHSITPPAILWRKGYS